MRIARTALVCALVAAPAAAAFGHPPGATQGEHQLAAASYIQHQLKKVRKATKRSQDVRVARRAGYIPARECVSSPEGGMGVHYTHPGLADDGRLDTDEDRPYLFGRGFDGPMEGHEPGMPMHYDLHAWVWKRNPAGTFAMWNPRVECPEEPR